MKRVLLLFIIGCLFLGTGIHPFKQETPNRRVQILNILKQLDADTYDEREAATENLAEFITEEDIPFIEFLYHDLTLEQRMRVQRVLVPMGWIPINRREDLRESLANLPNTDYNAMLQAFHTLMSIPNIDDQIQEVFTRYPLGHFIFRLDLREDFDHRIGSEATEYLPLTIEAESQLLDAEGFWAGNIDRAHIHYVRYYKKFSSFEFERYHPDFWNFFGTSLNLGRRETQFTNISEYRFYSNENIFRETISRSIFNLPGYWLVSVSFTFAAEDAPRLYWGDREFEVNCQSYGVRREVPSICRPNDDGFGKLEISVEEIDSKIEAGEELEVVLRITNNSEIARQVLKYTPRAWVFIEDPTNRDIFFSIQAEHEIEKQKILQPGEFMFATISFSVPNCSAKLYNFTFGFSDLMGVIPEARETSDPEIYSAAELYRIHVIQGDD